MKNWQSLCVAPDASVMSVIETLNQSGPALIALVVDEQGTLMGTITDGDLRRYMLAGHGLEGCAEDVMHRDCITAGENAAPAEIAAQMKAHHVRQVPIVDAHGQLRGVSLPEDVNRPVRRANPVLIMAGGRGSRLRPLTENKPKPLLEVGGKPILETIVENFRAEGFVRFFVSLGYLGHQIEAYFGDGSEYGIEMNYIREDQPLGTAGSLGLLPGELAPNLPLIVTNGDVLTRVRYARLLDFHRESGAELTVCLRDYQFEVPFGVINMQGDRVSAIVEKPVVSHHVSAGIYAMNPTVVGKIAANRRMDMPDLITELIHEGQVVTGFPLHEYWTDVGRHDELRLANQEYADHFE